MKEKTIKADQWIWNLTQKHLPDFLLFCLVAGSVLIRAHMAPMTISGDYQGFLTDWYNAYASEGLWQSFSHPITTYYEPYSFLMDVFAHLPFPLWLSITVTSCLAEYVGVWYVCRILDLLTGEETPSGLSAWQRAANRFAAVALLYLPMTMMNSALWKQCDSVYTCFTVISLYYFFRERYRPSFIFLAIAFVFKLQTGFILPFYVIVYLCRQRFSITKFLYLPAAYLLAGFPAVLLKRGIRATYGKYFAQFEYLPVISAGSPSIWRIGMKDYDAFAVPAIIVTLAVLAAATAVVWHYRETLNGRCLFYLAGWTTWTCFVLLPEMHERYDYLALFLLTAFMIAFRRKKLWTMIVANLCTAMTYGYYLFEGLEDYELFTFLELAIPYNLAWFVVTADLLKMLREEKAAAAAAREGMPL